MPHNVLAVANEFISRAAVGETNRRLTPMHLQKLCYFGHGFSLALLDRPLVKDSVEAWEYGPVFPTLYNALRRYGAAPVDEQIREHNWSLYPPNRGRVVVDDFGDEEREIIEGVLSTYGSFQAFQLSALTHESDSPWSKVYEPSNRHAVIPDSMIQDYFNGLAAHPE